MRSEPRSVPKADLGGPPRRSDCYAGVVSCRRQMDGKNGEILKQHWEVERCLVKGVPPSGSGDTAQTSPQPEDSVGPTPQLPNNASTIDKLNFALQILSWTETAQPPSSFDPDSYGNNICLGEAKTLEAMSALRTIPDSATDGAAKEQARMRADVVYNTAWDAAKDLILKGKIPDPAKSSEKLKDALAPTWWAMDKLPPGTCWRKNCRSDFSRI
jgi:hypothetical protein